MTHYVVHNNLSFCQIGEHFVFLDIDKDKYFCLPAPMEQALASHLDEGRMLDPRVSKLLERHTLSDRHNPAIRNIKGIKPAGRSAMETPLPEKRLRPFVLLEVLVIVLCTKLELKFFTLKHVLDGLCVEKHHQMTQVKPSIVLLERRLSDAAAIYRRARLYVPINMRCLLDSLAMAKFLRRRQLHTHIVFGVALDPFSAHCWVQLGDLVLNDTVGNVNSHTPIRVV